MNLQVQLKKTAQAARLWSQVSSDVKNRVLQRLGTLLIAASAELVAANQEDLRRFDESTSKEGLTASRGSAFRDRLVLNPSRIMGMVDSLKQIAQLDDPVGEEVDRRSLENGLLLKRVRSPLGVILLIFESRPNVAVESFGLALKSGNGLILKGGKESASTVNCLYRWMGDCLEAEGAPRDLLWGLPSEDRSIVSVLLQEKKWIDVVIPRGGDQLIEFVTSRAAMPVIKNDRGLCHVYVHNKADLNMAAEIVENGKTQRPGVCNAMETLLVDRGIASDALPFIARRLVPYGVQWRGCPRSIELLSEVVSPESLRAAESRDFDTEYLDLILNVKVVDGIEEALDHIAQHGSRHSEAIVTAHEAVARKFQSAVDAAVVYWNASTRFTDGYQFGLGGEIGISTQKLHVRGPVGLRELTCVRWIVDGQGQVRKS